MEIIFGSTCKKTERWVLAWKIRQIRLMAIILLNNVSGRDLLGVSLALALVGESNGEEWFDSYGHAVSEQGALGRFYTMKVAVARRR